MTTKMTGTFMEITPEIAGDWLEFNTRNRRPRNAHVKRISHMIKTEQWAVNGETIVRCENGTIADGQHRLLAVEMAGKSIWSWVVQGAPNDSYKTMDTGIRRQMGDLLEVEGFSYSRLTAAVCALEWRHEHDALAYRPTEAENAPSYAELREVIDRHPEIVPTVQGLGEIWPSRSKLLSKAVVAWLLMHFRAEDEEAADSFFVRLAHGNDISFGDPIRALRERLISNATAQAKLRQEHLMALTIKAWNAERAGHHLEVLSWRSGEPFPKIGAVSAHIVRSRANRASRRGEAFTTPEAPGATPA